MTPQEEYELRRRKGLALNVKLRSLYLNFHRIIEDVNYVLEVLTLPVAVARK